MCRWDFCFFVFFLINHFTEVSLTCKELCVLEECSMVGLEICPHQAVHHLQSLLPSLCVIIICCPRVHATWDGDGGRWESGPRLGSTPSPQEQGRQKQQVPPQEGGVYRGW